MKQKSWLILVLSCMFFVVISAIGVYAVSFVKLSLNGQVDFIDYDKVAYIEKIEVKTYANGKSEIIKTEILEQYNKKYVKLTNGNISIDVSSLKVENGQTMKIEITIMSLKSDSDLYVVANISDVAGLEISSSFTKLEKNIGQKVSSGVASVVEINILNTSTSAIPLGNVSTNLSFEDVSEYLNLIKTTTDSDGEIYHYVELGQLSNGTKLQWRYMADSDGNAYKSTTKPTTLSGYYILETRAGGGLYHYLENYTTEQPFYHVSGSGYEGIYAIDYATSELRQYINSTEYLDYLKISGSDIIYQMISSRTISDLYKKIKSDDTDILDTDTNYALSIPGIATQSDKLWIPSCYELRTMLCGGTWNYFDAGWGTNEDATDSDCDAYWLRSPSVWDEGYLAYVDSYGDWDSGPYAGLGSNLQLSYYVRPCFKI